MTPHMHMYAIYTQLVSVLNEIKLRMLFRVNRRHTRSHTLYHLCLSFIIFLISTSKHLCLHSARKLFFVSRFSMRGGRKRKRAVKMEIDCIVFALNLSVAITPTSGERNGREWKGKEGIGEKSKGGMEEKLGSQTKKWRDNRGRWRQQWLLRDEENTKEHQDGEKEREEGAVVGSLVHVQWSGVFNLTRWTSCPGRWFPPSSHLGKDEVCCPFLLWVQAMMFPKGNESQPNRQAHITWRIYSLVLYRFLISLLKLFAPKQRTQKDQTYEPLYTSLLANVQSQKRTIRKAYNRV